MWFLIDFLLCYTVLKEMDKICILTSMTLAKWQCFESFEIIYKLILVIKKNPLTQLFLLGLFRKF